VSPKQKNLAERISAAFAHINKKSTGSELAEVHTHFEDNLVVVRGKILFTPEEMEFLANRAGQKLVRQVRMQLLEDARPALYLKIGRLIAGDVRSSFIDVNLERGELLQIFVVQDPLDQVV
jgi:uncharacterized protein YbcI